MTDDTHRIHIAANDPAFPAQREAAVALIVAAIDALATGYTRRGTTWSRTTAQGRTIINLQRNQYGWYADINLRFILPDGTAADHGDWAAGDVLLGRIAYLDVNADAAMPHDVIKALRARALPWLDSHHDAAQ